jgi:2-oxo-hept-3-ene-1,7-dioate hydratase
MVRGRERLLAILVCAVAVFSGGIVHADEVERLGALVGAAVALGEPVPDVPDDLAEASAYRVQSSWVGRLYGTDFAGYKAGLTSAGAQQRFGITTPVLGVLPRAARLDAGAEIDAATGLMVEVEIGVLVGADAAPAGLVPVVELPRLSYAVPDALSAADVIASNVSAYRFVVGAPAPFDADVREVRVTLEHDGAVANAAQASDAMGDPLASYRWMVERIRGAGYRLEPGMVLLTGALGRVVDASPGRWVARYDGLGEVAFTIR